MNYEKTDSTVLQGKHLLAVLVDPSHADLIVGKNALDATNRIKIVGESTSYSLAFSLIERNNPSHVFFGVGEDSGLAAETISLIRRKFPALTIIAMGTHPDADDILQCFRAGADEFLVKPLQFEQITAALRDLHTRKSTLEQKNSSRGRIIAFWGSCGGCGTTTLACNTAHALAKTGPTVLVDLHCDQGDLFVHLDLTPKVSLRDIGDPPEQIDDTLIESVTTTHPSGLHLLLQPQDVHHTPLSHRAVERILEILERKYSYVVLDIGHNVAVAESLATCADTFCLVTVQTLPSLFLASQRIRLLNELGYEAKRTNVIVNKYVKTSRVGVDRVAKTLRVPRPFTIRNDEKRATASINRGIPLAEISRMGKAARDIGKLASAIRKIEPLLEIPMHEESAIPMRSPRDGTLMDDVEAYAVRR